MAQIDKLGSAKRFGARYGKKPKQLFAKIEKLQRSRHKCPYCHYKKVRRIAYGIWHCTKCNSKFTGRAYTVSEALPIKATSSHPENASEIIEEESPQEIEEGEQNG